MLLLQRLRTIFLRVRLVVVVVVVMVAAAAEVWAREGALAVNARFHG